MKFSFASCQSARYLRMTVIRNTSLVDLGRLDTILDLEVKQVEQVDYTSYYFVSTEGLGFSTLWSDG